MPMAIGRRQEEKEGGWEVDERIPLAMGRKRKERKI